MSYTTYDSPNHCKHALTRREQERQQSIEQYIDKCFALHSRLLILRVDFGYRLNVFPDMDVTMRHRDKLVRYLRETYKQLHHNAYIGLLWKLEYGHDKGYHLHTLIVLDGSKVQQDVTHAMIIGDYWTDHITDGDGLYYNCNADKDKYRRCGIGMVNYWDQQKRDYLLNDAASYLAKDDQLLQEMIQRESDQLIRLGEHELARQAANARCFGKSPLSSRNDDRPLRRRPRSRRYDDEQEG